jgi:hypothetical protein
MIARDLAHLHGDTLARLGNNLTKQTRLTEKGQIMPGLNDDPDPRHKMRTHGVGNLYCLALN